MTLESESSCRLTLICAPQNRPGWFDWHKANPDSFWQLCLDGEKIAALSRFVPIRLRLSGKLITAAFSNDTMVDSSYRRQGLGTRIHECRRQAFDVALSSDQSPENHRVYMKLGFEKLGDYFYFNAVPRFPKPFLKRRYLREIVGWLIWRSRFHTCRAVTVHTAATLPEDMARELIDERFCGPACGPVPSNEDILWRYARHPYFRYDFQSIRRDGNLLAVAVTRSEGAVVLLVDIYVRFLDVSTCLLRFAAPCSVTRSAVLPSERRYERVFGKQAGIPIRRKIVYLDSPQRRLI